MNKGKIMNKLKYNLYINTGKVDGPSRIPASPHDIELCGGVDFLNELLDYSISESNRLTEENGKGELCYYVNKENKFAGQRVSKWYAKCESIGMVFSIYWNGIIEKDGRLELSQPTIHKAKQSAYQGEYMYPDCLSK